jgi:hypothetical protein
MNSNSGDASMMRSIGFSLAACGVILAAGFAFKAALPSEAMAQSVTTQKDWATFVQLHELCERESAFTKRQHCPAVAAQLTAARIIAGGR